MTQDIFEFQGEHRWLSNFARCRALPGGTVEHMYQAMKFVDTAPRIYALVLKQTAARDTKIIARRAKKHWSPTWLQDNYDIMRSLLLIKFHPVFNPILHQRLVDTGDAFLVEGNTWHDQFWGVCNCARHRGDGQNKLGQLLMLLRSSYQ